MTTPIKTLDTRLRTSGMTKKNKVSLRACLPAGRNERKTYPAITASEILIRTEFSVQNRALPNITLFHP
jgi:hypothetical protein